MNELTTVHTPLSPHEDGAVLLEPIVLLLKFGEASGRKYLRYFLLGDAPITIDNKLQVVYFACT